uniref:RING-type domain-containing protein n=1 Tax=Loa loa TaxID=7209 RepID=A0A1I7VK44_LOALO
MQLANESTNGLKLKFRIYLRRMRIQEQTDNLLKKTDTTPLETAREWEMEIERQELKHFADVLKSSNCSDIFEIDISEIIRPLITVPNGGLMYENPTISEDQFNHRFAYFNYSFKYITRLMLKPDCATRVEGVSVPHIVTLEQYGVSHDGSMIGAMGAPRFLFFVSKVSSSYLRLLNISTPSLVMTFAMVYLLSFKLRDILMTKPFELTFRELGDPSRLIRLCASISIGPMKHAFHEDSAGNACSNCQIMQFKVEIRNAKLNELQAKRKERTDSHISNISKMDGDARKSAKMFARTTKMINWETRYVSYLFIQRLFKTFQRFLSPKSTVWLPKLLSMTALIHSPIELSKNLEKKFKQLEENMVSQKSAFESEIKQCQNEKDELKERLRNVERKILTLNLALQKNCNEGVELLAVKENVEKRFKEEHEKQKREMENAARKRLEEGKRQCHLKAVEIVQFERMLKKAHEENMELCYRFHRAVNSLQSVKFAAEEPANFQHHLEEKLSDLVKKFRNEANNSETKVMKYVLNYFEAAVEVILSDEPHLCYLIRSSTALALVRSEETNERLQITTASSNANEKSVRKEKKKALAVRIRIEFLLHNYCVQNGSIVGDDRC